MFPLILDVNVVKVWLPAESKALCYVANGHDHLLVKFHPLNIFNVGIYQLFVQFNILKFRGNVHYVEHAIRNVMVCYKMK